MKICIVHDQDFRRVLGNCGAYYTAKYLAKYREVHAIIPKQFSNQNMDDITIHELYFPSTPPINFLIYNILAFFTLVKLQFKNRFEIVYTYGSTLILGALIKSLFGVTWVSDFRHSPLRQDTEFLKLRYNGRGSIRYVIFVTSLRLLDIVTKTILRYCDFVIAISEEIKEELINEYHIDPEKIHIQGSGVDLSRFIPSDKKKDDTFRIVCVSFISNNRGIDTLILALKELVNKIPEIKLILAGTGPEKDVEELEDMIKKLKIEKYVDMKGFVDHDKIPALLDEADIAISPIPNLEAYKVSSPEKVFEYLGMNKAVIATDIIAHRKVIKNEWNGLLIKPEDPDELARAIEKLYTDKNLRKRLESNARRSVEKYDWGKNVEIISEKLEKIVEK